MDKPISLIFLLLLLVLHVRAVPAKTQFGTNNQSPKLAKGFQPRSNISFVDSNSLWTDSSKKSFSFGILCMPIASPQCQGTKIVVQSVEKRLNTLFHLKSTIEIVVNVAREDYFAEEDPTIASTLLNKYVAVRIPELAEDGKRVPVKSHRTSFVDGYEGVYRVPLALAKQMDLSGTIEKKNTMVMKSDFMKDIYIVINPRQKYFYGDLTKDYKGLLDLEATIMHEVLVRDGFFIYYLFLVVPLRNRITFAKPLDA
jgi:hypothetical protein